MKKIIRTIVVALVLLGGLPAVTFAGVQTFTDPALNGTVANTFTVLAGVTSVSVSMSGGGGACCGSFIVVKDGGNSSFGSLLTVNGGHGAKALQKGTAGGAGGTDGTSGVICGGAANCPGVGGNSLFGTGGDVLSGVNNVYWTNTSGTQFRGSPGQGYGSGGSGCLSSTGNVGFGGGGGAGAVDSQQLTVVPGTPYQITVGAGGKWDDNGAGAGAPGFVSVSYVDPGMVDVSSNISSSWTITGPETITGSGTSQSVASPPGTYTIIWNDVPEYTTPATQSFTLASGGTINFGGTYTAITCANGATNPTACDQCPATYSYNGTSCVACSNGGCSGTEPSLICNNGALNPPTCSQCPAGNAFLSPSCIPCVGGCSGSEPSLTCNNLALNPPYCSVCPGGQDLSTGVCAPTAPVSLIGNGACDAGEELILSECGAPKTKWWMF